MHVCMYVYVYVGRCVCMYVHRARTSLCMFVCIHKSKSVTHMCVYTQVGERSTLGVAMALLISLLSSDLGFMLLYPI